MKKICVLGLGYIGLPTAAALATKGFKVVGVDISPEVIDKIDRCAMTLNEPELDVFVKAAIKSGNLKASRVVEPADAFLICVPTPFRENHEPDLTCVEDATRAIVKVIQKGNLVVLESTVPPFTCERVLGKILSESGLRIGEDIYVAHCPERVLPGNILKELIENDRIVGGINDISTKKAVDLYKTYVNGNIISTSAPMAEMCKLVENSYRDLNIAFANTLQLICHRMNIDVWQLIEYANLHPRVKIAQPGPGVGGHCIAVDPWFIVHHFPEESILIREARKLNDRMPYFVADRVEEVAKKLAHPVIGLLGMTYKEDVDDLRESPSIEVLEELKRRKLGTIMVCEPHASMVHDTEVQSIETILESANLLVVLVAHKEFRHLNWSKIRQKKEVLDFRNIISTNVR